MAFEDSRAGVDSARAAGCILVTVQTLYDEKTLGPALRSIRDFTDPDLRIFLDKIAP
jgi:beta-phosphoglucomutase-like phosphatase (HAD superfamily)